MKICPSCSVRVADDKTNCPSCDHEFESRDQKKTMMGMPVVTDEGDVEEEAAQAETDSKQGGDGGLDIDRAKLSKALDKAREESSAQETNEQPDDSTRQVSATELSDALGGGSEDTADGGDPKSTAFGIPSPDMDDDQEGEDAADAWGLGDQPSSGEVAATAVVDPDKLDFSDDASGGLSFDGGGSTPDPVTGAPEPDAGEEQERDFGTLMGMSLDEQSDDDESEGAAMQFGGEPEAGANQNGSTQALSPEELAKVEEMNFGESAESSDPSERLQPGRKQQSTPTSDNLKTAVVDDSFDPSNFQLPKPGKEEDSSLQTPDTSKKTDASKSPGEQDSSDQPSKTAKAPQRKEQTQDGSPSDQADHRPTGKEEKKSARDRQKDTPMSGVFRAAGQKKKSPKDEEGGPDSANITDTGVTGTGTYQMSNTSTGSESEDSVESEDENLALGAVGAGGKTDFPAGRDSEKVPQPAEKSPEQSRDKRPEDSASGVGIGDKPSTGPAFGIGGADEPESQGGQVDVDAEESSEAIDPQDESVPEQSQDGQEKRPPRDSSPLDDVALSGVDFEEGVDGADPVEQEVESTASALAQEPSQSPQPGIDGTQTTDRGEELAVSNEEVRPADAGPQPEDSQPAKPQQVAQQPEDSQPAKPQQVAQQPEDSQPAKPEPTEESSERGADEDTEGLDIAQLVSLLQRGFGVLAAVAMVVGAVAALVFEGLPSEMVEIGAAAMPVGLGVLALVVTLLPISGMQRSAGYGMTGGVALLGFGAILVAGFGPVLAIANFAGGALLLVAAAFPFIGRAVK